MNFGFANQPVWLTSVACHRLVIVFGREREVLGDGLPANDDNADIQRPDQCKLQSLSYIRR